MIAFHRQHRYPLPPSQAIVPPTGKISHGTIFNDGSKTNAYDIGWDDLTNGKGGNPDGDFNDIRLTTVAISKSVSTKHLEVFY